MVPLANIPVFLGDGYYTLLDEAGRLQLCPIKLKPRELRSLMSNSPKKFHQKLVAARVLIVSYAILTHVGLFLPTAMMFHLCNSPRT